MSRVVSGLILARRCPRPRGIPVSRPRKASKVAGLRYERELAKALPVGLHGAWFEFWDDNGPGHCQPDILVDLGSRMLVLEAKYTWVEAGHGQIEHLYRPVVEMALGKPTIGVVVCKVLTPEVVRSWVCRGLEEAIQRAGTGSRTVLHWIGAGLGPLQGAFGPSHLASEFARL